MRRNQPPPPPPPLQQQHLNAEPEYKGRTRKIYDKLKEKLDAGITAQHLYQHGALNKKDFEEIQRLSTTGRPTAAAEQLLNIILSKTEDFYDCFLDSLIKTDQLHVHQWIASQECDPDVKCTAWIRNHYVFLHEQLDSVFSGLIDRLYQYKVINQAEHENIRRQVTSFKQNESLLSILGRKSSEKIEMFFTALDETGQSHIREIIREGTDIVAQNGMPKDEQHAVPVRKSAESDDEVPPKRQKVARKPIVYTRSRCEQEVHNTRVDEMESRLVSGTKKQDFSALTKRMDEFNKKLKRCGRRGQMLDNLHHNMVQIRTELEQIPTETTGQEQNFDKWILELIKRMDALDGKLAEFSRREKEQNDCWKDMVQSTDKLGQEFLELLQMYNNSYITGLPLEILETVLMRTFVMLYAKDDNESVKSSGSERRAFTVISSVCFHWYRALTGWPESPTRFWLKHQLKRLIERSCRPFQRSAEMRHQLAVKLIISGVTLLHDVIFIACCFTSTILRFDARTYERLSDIDIKDLRRLWDIAACMRNSRVYVADSDCVWRMAADGSDIKRWLPRSPSEKDTKDASVIPDHRETFKPSSLTVTPTGLLVTSPDTHLLIQFDDNGDELRRVQLPDDMEPLQAVESPTGSFIVSTCNENLEQLKVSEVNLDGKVLRQFSRALLLSQPYCRNVAVDSRGRILVADAHNHRILLLDTYLNLRRVIIDEDQLYHKQPHCMCYVQQSGQLLVASLRSLTCFKVR